MAELMLWGNDTMQPFHIAKESLPAGLVSLSSNGVSLRCPNTPKEIDICAYTLGVKLAERKLV